MKKLLITLITLLSILSISCEKKPTEPTNNNNNNANHSQSFTGNFTFGTFGNVSALFINEDGSIYMNIENGLLTIKKEMITKISDSQYTIKGQMPTIKYDTSSATSKSIMFAQNAADMNAVDVSLNLSGKSLSLSGQVNSDNVNANLTEVSGYIPNDYAGVYYIGDGINDYGFEIKSDGTVVNIELQNGNVIYHKGYTDKLIKVSENEYILNINSLENNTPSTGPISFADAEIIVLTEAEKYYNISGKYTLKFENNTMSIIGGGYTVHYKDVDTIGKYIEEVAKDRSYTNQIDYSLFTFKLGSPTTDTFTKK
ncbi:hypothetical protein Bint_1091 [Brachyspira intermedia PWS/A]|uniref:Lipoprotein n=1 Tax=Brachyspira intermedia (strain ATCC 51140 / PWS/A) TaxID=1045858 RepID=G0EMM6_BRAIP|nr:hypothetical protein [Brachyspira intermedia]AEM21714.1 hypothetical protein Bint_1091 [Brachyspira intermedia PWS/A]